LYSFPAICLVVSVLFFPSCIKYPIALLCFMVSMTINIRFRSVGRYTYLLHLYHSPIIVVSYPLLRQYIHHPLLSICLQVLFSVSMIAMLYWCTKKIKTLTILSGGR
jgi:peptidoglycan/LPS O-acetylase OafA/YrhL